MTDTVLPRTPRLLDRHFRWRSGEVSRLESLTDAVFAIVLGLLFLQAAPPESFTQVKAAMKGLIPFAATFAIIAYVWVEHWLFARRYDLHDVWTTFLNVLLLFLLLSYAYPLKYLFTVLTVEIFGPIGALTSQQLNIGMGNSIAEHVRLFVFYGIGYGGIFLLLALMYVRAYRLRDLLLLSPLEVHLTKAAIYQCSIHTLVSILSMVIVVAEPAPGGAPGWIYCAIGPLMAVHGTWEGRRTRRLLAAK